jgi:hypothetical protein
MNVMDSINSILMDKNFDEPPEIIAIKRYVERHFKSKVNVKLGAQAIIISTESAALIGTLRMYLREIQAAAGTDKKLILRVG